jgi:hypothetical protein
MTQAPGARAARLVLAAPVAAMALGLVVLLAASEHAPDALQNGWKTLLKKHPDGEGNFLLAYFAGNAMLAISLLRVSVRDFVVAGLWALRPLPLVLYAAYVVICSNAFEIILLRRLAFSFAIFPLAVFLLVALYRSANALPAGSRSQRLALGLFAIGAINALVPGFYAPPFFDGIAGWVEDSSDDRELRLRGLELVRADGSTHWYPHALFSPVT